METIFARLDLSAVYEIRHICYGCSNIDLSRHERETLQSSEVVEGESLLMGLMYQLWTYLNGKISLCESRLLFESLIATICFVSKDNR